MVEYKSDRTGVVYSLVDYSEEWGGQWRMSQTFKILNTELGSTHVVKTSPAGNFDFSASDLDKDTYPTWPVYTYLVSKIKGLNSDKVKAEIIELMEG